MAKFHQDNSGRPTMTRGKAPHKGGYTAGRDKSVNFRKVWVVCLIGGKDVRASSWKKFWHPGK